MPQVNETGRGTACQQGRNKGARPHPAVAADATGTSRARRTHDHQRHGTTALFAALDIATGRVTGCCYQRHRAVDFRRFLAAVEQAVPADLDIHLVLDNLTDRASRPNT